jgi:hypothetical protein
VSPRLQMIEALKAIRDIAEAFGGQEHAKDCPARDPEIGNQVCETEDEDMLRCVCLPGAIERIHRLANAAADR